MKESLALESDPKYLRVTCISERQRLGGVGPARACKSVRQRRSATLGEEKRGVQLGQTAVPAPALRAESQLVASQGPTRFGKCKDRRKRIINDRFSMPKLEGEN